MSVRQHGAKISGANRQKSEGGEITRGVAASNLASGISVT